MPISGRVQDSALQKCLFALVEGVCVLENSSESFVGVDRPEFKVTGGILVVVSQVLLNAKTCGK